MFLGCFNIINSYPPFGSHFKNGIDNLLLHPFTLLLLVEVPVRTNDHQFDRSSDMFFLVEYLDKISIKISLCDGFWAAMDLAPPPGQKIGKKKTCLNLNMKDPESMAGKIMVEYTVTVKIRLLPKSTCKFLHPDIGKKNLNPRVQPLYSLSLSAEICTLT